MDKCKILFLAANPQGTTPLALDKEIREIEAKIRASEYRDSLALISKWAVEDIQDELAKPEPDRDEIGNALDRALKYARQAEGFASIAGKLQAHVANAASWLGDNWHKLLSLVGLTLYY